MSTSRRSPARAYAAAVARHEKKLVKVTASRERALRDPELATSLGLPAELPDATRVILAQTHALSHVGPQRPKRSDYYDTPDREESPWVP